MASTLENFSLNGSQIRRSNTIFTTSRPSTGKSIQSNSLTSNTVKRAQYMRKKNNEIERWAYNDDKIEIGYESDEVKSVDDDYIDKIAEKDFEEIVLDQRTMEKKRHKFHHVLKTFKEAKMLRTEMMKKNAEYEFNINDYGNKEMIIDNIKPRSANSVKKNDESIIRKKDINIRKSSTWKGRSGNVSRNNLSDISKLTSACTFDLKAYEAIKFEMEEAERAREEEERNKAQKEEVKLENSIKYKNAKNGLSRMVPGKLQQNITLERTFFKDLLKLSRERYITRLNSDFQKRKFLEAQSKKGLCDDGRKRDHSSRPRLSAPTGNRSMPTEFNNENSNQSTTNNERCTKAYSYKPRSVSANFKRNLLSTPIDHQQISNSEKPNIRLLQTPAIPEIEDNDEIKGEIKSGNFFKKQITPNPKLSFKSGDSEDSNKNSVKSKNKSRSPHSNRPNTAEDSFHFEKEKKIRCVSAYVKRKPEALARFNPEKENQNISSILSVGNRDEIQAVRNENLATNIKFKRPNTCIAYHRVSKSKDADNKNEELENSYDDKIPAYEETNPVTDKRYTMLLNSMAGCYSQKNCGEFSVNVDERVNNLISNNTALQCDDSVNVNRKSRVHMNRNLMFFEKLITNYF